MDLPAPPAFSEIADPPSVSSERFKELLSSSFERNVLDVINPDLPLYWDRKGRQISCRQWSALFEDRCYQQLLRTKIRHGTRKWVSTVWTGLLSWPFSANQSPYIFESAVFDGDAIIHTYRYRTEDEAIVGHRALVTEYRDNRRRRRWRHRVDLQQHHAQRLAHEYMARLHAECAVEWAQTNNYVEPEGI